MLNPKTALFSSRSAAVVSPSRSNVTSQMLFWLFVRRAGDLERLSFALLAGSVGHWLKAIAFCERERYLLEACTSGWRDHGVSVRETSSSVLYHRLWR